MSSPHPHNDKQLFTLISQGDETAFSSLFEQYLPKLTPFAWEMTHDWEEAREIVQETFLRIWLGRDKLADIENPAGWIFTIASNQCYKLLRRKVLKDSRFLSTETTEESDAAIDIWELKKLISEAVGDLSEQRKKIFILSRERGMTIPEIAEELDLSPNTVKNTLVSALKYIQDRLKAQGYMLPALILLWS